MAKLLSFLAVTGTAAAAAAEPTSASGARGGLTTAGLERTTRRFAVEHRLARGPGDDGGGRQLRSSSNQQTRHGKESKKGYDDDDDYVVHRHHHHGGFDDDDYYYGKSGKGSKGSSGGSKGSKSNGGGDWDVELFYLLPSACPNECISSHVTEDTSEFMDSIKPCQADEESQMWLVHSDGSYVMIESYDKPHMCLGVDYQTGDDQALLAQTCYNGELVLRDCADDYGTEWYFTGGQLVSALCWGAGLASMMTVFLGESSDDVQQCRKDVAVWGANDEAVLKSDTFLFVNRLPAAPFIITDVNDALQSEDNRMAASVGIAADVARSDPAVLDFDGAA